MTDHAEPDHSSRSHPPFVEEYALRRPTVLGSAMGSGALGGFTGFMGWITVGRGDPLGWIFVALTVILLGVTLGWFRRLWTADPALVLTDQGVLDASALGRPVFISWDDVRAVREDGQATVLVLADDHEVDLPFHKRVVGRLLRRSRDEYLLPTVGMEASATEITERIRAHHDGLLLGMVRTAAKEVGPASDAPAGPGGSESPDTE